MGHRPVNYVNNRVDFGYLRIVVKKYNLVLALVIAYNREWISNININKFKWVNS